MDRQCKREAQSPLRLSRGLSTPTVASMGFSSSSSLDELLMENDGNPSSTRSMCSSPILESEQDEMSSVSLVKTASLSSSCSLSTCDGGGGGGGGGANIRRDSASLTATPPPRPTHPVVSSLPSHCLVGSLSKAVSDSTLLSPLSRKSQWYKQQEDLQERLTMNRTTRQKLQTQPIPKKNKKQMRNNEMSPPRRFFGKMLVRRNVAPRKDGSSSGGTKEEQQDCKLTQQQEQKQQSSATDTKVPRRSRRKIRRDKAPPSKYWRDVPAAA